MHYKMAMGTLSYQETEKYSKAPHKETFPSFLLSSTAVRTDPLKRLFSYWFCHLFGRESGIYAGGSLCCKLNLPYHKGIKWGA